MKIDDILRHIARNYREALTQKYSAHPVASFIRNDAVAEFNSLVPQQQLIIKGSAGNGRWTFLPWIALFDPAVSRSAQSGYYVVYLFSEDMRSVYLSLNQGAKRVHDEFAGTKSAIAELENRAHRMRQRIVQHAARLNDFSIQITKSSVTHPYEAGHALGKAYKVDALPKHKHLFQDLLEALKLYRTLIMRGGTSAFDTDEWLDEIAEKPLTEMRRYIVHRTIERNQKTSQYVKAARGHQCEACGFDFHQTYGEPGLGFIEAHHLIPLSSLPEGEPVPIDPYKDFAVLCSNCHRIAHRRSPPYSVKEIQTMIYSTSRPD